MDGPTSLDDILQNVGQCGPFQGLLVLLVHSTVVASVGGMMMMAFGSYSPGWDCLDLDGAPAQDVLSPVTHDGIQLSSKIAISSSNQSGFDNTTDRCIIYNSCRNVSFHPGSSTIATEWGLVCDRAWALKVILTVQMVGVLFGAYVVGHMGDCIGRKVSLYIMVALHAVSNLIAVFSPSWEVFAAIRFFIGFGSGGIITPAYIIPLEFAGQLWRGVISALPTWNISASLLSFFVVLLKDWRHLQLLYAGLSCLALLPMFWVPESFRWLAVHGRDERACDVANRIARLNKRPPPSLEVLVNMAESERRRAVVERTERYSYFDLFRIALVRKQTFVMTFIWLFLSVVYFGISFNVQVLSGDFYINFIILSVMEIPSMLIAMPTNSFLSRRLGASIHLFIVSMACLGITTVSLAIKTTTGDDDANNANMLKSTVILCLAVVAKLGVLCAWNVIIVYCVELYPTVVRNMGYSYLNAIARLGSLVGPLLFPHDPALLYLAMIVLGIMAAISIGLLLLLPETKGTPLEDMFPVKTCPDKGQGSHVNSIGKGRDESEKRAEECFQGTSLL